TGPGGAGPVSSPAPTPALAFACLRRHPAISLRLQHVNLRRHVRITATQFLAIGRLDMVARLDTAKHWVLAQLLFWSIVLILMLEDDVAMLAMMMS
ncbi:hypothetical protein, partial [Herbaspirillum seropedicae]